MKRNDLIAEIQKIIDKVPEEILEEIYEALKELSSKDSDSIKISHNLNKILTEDKTLLERLAK